MAKQIITTLIDDLDGQEADETVTFALDGMGYTIDLSEKNAASLRQFLATFMDAAQRTGRLPGGGHAQPQRTRPQVGPVFQESVRAQRESNQAIREWALDNGFDLAARGRIPGNVVDAYEARATVNAAKQATGAKRVGVKVHGSSD